MAWFCLSACSVAIHTTSCIQNIRIFNIPPHQHWEWLPLFFSTSFPLHSGASVPDQSSTLGLLLIPGLAISSLFQRLYFCISLCFRAFFFFSLRSRLPLPCEFHCLCLLFWCVCFFFWRFFYNKNGKFRSSKHILIETKSNNIKVSHKWKTLTGISLWIRLWKKLGMMLRSWSE